MKICPHCGYSLEPSSAECPQCGRSIPPASPSIQARSTELIRNYFHDLKHVITHPAEFFRALPLKGGWGGPLAFALTTHWIGESIEFIWRSIITGMTQKSFWDLSRFMEGMDPSHEIDSPGRQAALFQMQERITHWFWGAGSVIIDPFYTLAAIFLTTLFVFAGARLLVTPGKNGAPREIKFETALRIVCFGMSPAIFAALPLVGGAVASIGTAVVTIIGAREVYRVSTGRAAIIALFPKLLILGIMMSGLLLLFTILFKVATAFF